MLESDRFTRDFPSDERFGMISPRRRAAVSVAGNIAEGFPKRSDADNIRFFNIARGSLEETPYYLILSNDLGYGGPSNLLDLYDEVARLLTAYSKRIRESS